MTNIEKIDLNIIDWKSSKEFFDSLTTELEKLDNRDEAYNFTWVGKRKSIIEAGAPIDKILRPDVEASKDFGDTENMLIVGDNLDALKILQESYLGQVKMIYIDPPYNTGHDFVYHDNFSKKKNEYEDNSVSEDNEIVSAEDEFIENSKSNGRFHSDWLSMMYPRLKLAHSLLSDDGVIFISIDDNEQANLNKLCNEIFGNENVETMIWKKNDFTDGVLKLTYRFRCEHEYIVVCYKNKDATFFNKVLQYSEVKNEYGNADNDPRGNWISAEICRSEEKSKKDSPKYYELTAPNGTSWVRQWLFEKDEMQRMIDDGRVYFGKNGDSLPRWKKFVNEKREKSATSMLLEYGSARSAMSDMKTLFNDRVFDYPKPVQLEKYLLSLAKTKDSLILDFFAGSGTTGHAVMDLNAEDGGNRKYILVQLPEKTNEKSEARKAGYETIDQITAERLRRAGEKVKQDHPDANIDVGFRVFRVDSTNIKDGIRKSVDLQDQEDMFDQIDNIKSDRTPLDLLFGAVYASAMPFDEKLEIRQIGENTVYLYGYFDEGSGLIACFDDNISDDTVKEIAKLKPLSAVFRDSSFSNSAAKINLSEHFRILSVDTKVKVI